MLRVLHGHLGAQVPAEASAALGVLVSLAKQHGEALLGYAAFLTTVLDYVEGYTDPQVQQVGAAGLVAVAHGVSLLPPFAPALHPLASPHVISLPCTCMHGSQQRVPPKPWQVFVVLGELVARGCAQADAGGGGRWARASRGGFIAAAPRGLCRVDLYSLPRLRQGSVYGLQLLSLHLVTAPTEPAWKTN